MAEERDRAVADHYETYPYPARDPAAEKTRLIEGSPSRFAEIEHYLFAGRAPRPFQALVAGGGAGDGAIMLAQHLADAGVEGEVVWLDLSLAARKVAEARAAARGLKNIRFVTGSLLAARAAVGDGFDYVDCCGVLHHLDAPEAGLAALADVLRPEGGMGIMVYGRYGRRGVYEMQALAEALAPQELPPKERLAIGRRLFEELPKTHWLKRNPFVRDHLDGGDAGFYDLLLHARDRAYTVPDVYALARSAGLDVVRFIEPAFYEPESYLKDRTLKAAAAKLALADRAAMAERLSGAMTKHVAYLAPVARAAEAAARPDAPDLIPVLRDADGPRLAGGLNGGRLGVRANGLDLAFALPRLAPAILRRVDNQRSLAAIHADIQAADAALDWPKFLAAFAPVFEALNGLNLMWLRRG